MIGTSVRGRLLATSFLATAIAGPAFAQPAAGAAPGQAVEEVVITGSRIARTDTETSAPVVIIDPEVLKDRGFIQAGQVLNQTPSIIPSVPQANGSGSAAGGGQQFPNLFGLGAGRTLTLVNGRRFVTSSQGLGDRVVDTNVIPVGLISRIDIVQAGGAAVYGSDAIAGVINYVLKDHFTGVELDAQYSRSSRDDYPVTSLRGTFGRDFLDGRGNVAMDVEWTRTRPLLDYDRPRTNLGRVTISNPSNTSTTDGIPAVRENLNTRFVTFNYNGVISTAGPPFASSIFAVAGTRQQLDITGTSLVPYNIGNLVNPTVPPFTSGGDGLPYQELASLYVGVERLNLNGVAHYDITDRIRLSTEVLYTNIKSRDPYQNLASNTVLNNAASGAGAIPVARTNPFLTPAITALLGPGGPPLFLSKAFIDLLPTREGTLKTETARVALALDGDFDVGERKYDWSLSYSHAETDGQQRGWGVWTQHFNSAVNAVRNATGTIVCAINADANLANDDASCSPLNPFGRGNISPGAQQYATVQVGQDYLNFQDDLLAVVSGDLFQLPAGMSKFSASYEHRREEAKFVPLSANQRGLVGSQVPTVATRGQFHTDELAAEALIPIVGGDFTFPFAKMVELSAQARYVDNSIAGKEEVWGVGGRWEIVEGFTVRASRSRNFRAPTLDQLFAPSRTALGSIGVDPCDADRIAGGPAPSVRLSNCQALFAANPGYGPLATFQDLAENFAAAQITTGGNANLANEISKTWTFGFVLQPKIVPGLTVVVDRVQVDLTDGLSAFTPANFLATCFDSSPRPADICATFTRDAAGQVVTARTTTFNAGRVKFRGEVYSIVYRFPLGRYFEDRDLGEVELDLAATRTEKLETSVTGFDISRTDNTVAVPDISARFDVRYNQGPFRATYQVQYLSPVKFDFTASIETTPQPHVKANVRHNLSAAWDFGPISVRGGVINLTDEEPSYPTRSYGDILGRQFFMGVNARF